MKTFDRLAEKSPSLFDRKVPHPGKALPKPIQRARARQVHTYEEKPCGRRGGKTLEYVKNSLHWVLGKGKHNAITTRQIADKLQVRRTGTNEIIRTACKELLKHELVGIAGCSKGMYIAETIEEAEEVIANLMHRRAGIDQDIAAWVDIIARMKEHMFQKEIK